MGITVLGPLLVAGAGNLSRRDRVVLAALAVRLGHHVRTDELIDALWGEQPPSSAHKILQGCIVRLRKVLGPDAIQTSAHGYLLALPPDQLDSQCFEQLVVRARELIALGQADRASYQATEALSLWNGDAFGDLEEWQPALREARRLTELRLEAEELRVDALIRAGRHSEVLAEIQTLVRAAPLREHRWVLQARAQYQAGQQGEALRTLHQLKTVLTTKLGVDPGPDVVALEQAILRQDPTLVSGGPVVVAGSTCPYQGLQAFDVEDADRFFGRQPDVDACLDVLRRTSLLALVGPSGSGKSSLMRAGLGAALRARGTPTVTITPGPRPLEALTALANAPAGASLLIDQFEELFSLCDDVTQRQEFLSSLVEETQARTVVIALRADHLADLASYDDFVRLLERGLYIVGGLGEAGLTQAIEAPARQTGLIIEAGLVDLLVREVKDDPGALPLLSHVLLETWRRREGNTLTVGGYRDSGGIHGAVAQSAEALYAKVAVDQRHTLRDLVLRLVAPGPQGEPVRSRVPRRMVATDHDRDMLIEKLVAARLVTSDDGVLEITHEALARAWPRLRGWLDDDVEGQRMLHHLFTAADAWDSMGRPDSEVYRGVRLARIRDLQAGSTATLTDTEQAFLAASQQLAELEERSAEDRARVQARLIRRLRGVLTGAVVLLVLALAAGGVAAVQSKRAGENEAQAVASRQAAERDEVRALVRQAALRSEATDDVDLSLLLAAAATKLDSSPESTDALARALSRNPALVRSTPLAAEDSTAIDLSPDGRRIAMIDARHHVRLVDGASGTLVAESPAGAARSEGDASRSIEFSPDGRLLAVGRTPLSRDPVGLLDGETLAAVRPRLGGLPPADWRAADVAFSQDGGSLAVALQRLRLRGGAREVASLWVAVWRLDRPARPLLRQLPRGDSGWASIALSPAGDSVYALPSRRVYDLTRGGGDQAFYRDGIEHADGIGRAGGIALSPNGRLLAFGVGTLQGAVVMDLRTGGVLHRLAPDMTISNIRFSRDGSRLMTTHWGAGRITQVWDVRSGRSVGDMSLTDGSEQAVDLSGAGDTVVSLDWQGTVRRWDATGRRRYLRRLSLRGVLPEFVDAGGSCFVTPSSGGEFVAYVNCGSSSERLNNSYLLLDVAGRRARLVPGAITGWHFGGGSWREGAGTFLRADGGFLREYDGRDGKLLRALHPLGDWVADVDHSPDGSVVAAVETSGHVTMLDADTLEPMGAPVNVGESAAAVSMGPDNRTAFVMTVAPRLLSFRFWDVDARGWALVDLEQGSVVRQGELDFKGNWPAYSPDGDHAVITGFSGEVLVIDLRSGEPVEPAVRAHAAGVFWAAFSPDGSRLVTSATDGTVVLWETRTATQLAWLKIPVPGQSAAEFRSDGKVLIAPWMEDASAYEWDPSAERAADFACRAAGRDLSEQEWQDAFGDLPYQEVCTEF